MALTKASLIDVNGQELILDADADTSITADTDDQIDFKVGGTDRLTLSSDGKLKVTEIAHISSGTLEIGNGDEKQLFDASGATIQFQTSDSERMRITTNNVFLNQTATADSGVADARLEITRGNQHCINCHVGGSGNSTLVAFINDNGFVGGINTNGSATVYNTSSDARLKNVLGEAKGLEVVNALNPVNFEWKSDGKIQDGLIAQEVEKVFPDAVSEPELKGEWYSVDYSKLVTPLIKAIQEQQEQIEALQSEINTLKGE